MSGGRDALPISITLTSVLVLGSLKHLELKSLKSASDKAIQHPQISTKKSHFHGGRSND
jgi:hypothetical protein